ncbi:MAG: response regulator transcription factor [Atopobiaceae bacterium]
MISLLVVEDDREFNHAVSRFLAQNGYKVTGCATADEALSELFAHRFDLVISDIMMPGTDGIAFAEKIRSCDKNLPILFVTARDDLLSKERGFHAGVDDYLVKPVDLHELLWHVQALLRRAKIEESRHLSIGNLEMDVDARTVEVDGKEVELTAREFDVLLRLLSSPNKAFTRAQLLDEFWDDGATSSRSVDVYIVHLRQKLGAADGFEIKTVYGMGYKAVLK